MNIILKHTVFLQKQFSEETRTKIYLGKDPSLKLDQDPDPDVF
jgi:hypothetical protein